MFTNLAIVWGPHLVDDVSSASPGWFFAQDPSIQRLLTVLAESIDEKSSYDMRQAVAGGCYRGRWAKKNHGIFPVFQRKMMGNHLEIFRIFGGSSRIAMAILDDQRNITNDENQVLEHLDPEPVIKAHADLDHWIWFLGNLWDKGKALAKTTKLVGGLEHFDDFSHHIGDGITSQLTFSPSIIFQRGGLKPATRKCWFDSWTANQLTLLAMTFCPVFQWYQCWIHP